jgi:hypothetical protein
MNLYSFYHKETGAIHQKRFSTDDPTQVRGNTPADHIAIDGHHDHLSKRVDVSVPPELVDDISPRGFVVGKRIAHKIIDYQPPAPSAQHEWDAVKKRWQLSAAAQGKAQARQAAQARIAGLRASSIDVMRSLLLGNESARAQLQAIADEIEAALQAAL